MDSQARRRLLMAAVVAYDSDNPAVISQAERFVMTARMDDDIAEKMAFFESYMPSKPMVRLAQMEIINVHNPDRDGPLSSFKWHGMILSPVSNITLYPTASVFPTAKTSVLTSHKFDGTGKIALCVTYVLGKVKKDTEAFVKHAESRGARIIFSIRKKAEKLAVS